MRSALFLVPALLIGCGSPPPEAPEGIDALAQFLAVHFDDEDPAELIAGVRNLDLELNALDLTAEDVDERAFTINALPAASLGGMPEHAGFNIETQVPVAVAGQSSFPLEDQLRVVTEPNHVCLGSATTKYHSRTFRTDTSCFLDQSCDRLTADNEIRKENFLARVWYDEVNDFRWLETDDGPLMVQRNYLPGVFPTDNGNGSWDQTYLITAFIPTADGASTRKFTSMWSSVTVGGLGDDLWANAVKDGIVESAGFQDDYLNGFADELCDEDRDRAYDRPAAE